MKKLRFSLVPATLLVAVGVAGLTVSDASARRARRSARYSDLMYLTTHNAYANDKAGWVYGQQHKSLDQQLQYGVRSFMLDIHWAKGSSCTKVRKKVNVAERKCSNKVEKHCQKVRKAEKKCKKKLGVLGRVGGWLCKTVRVWHTVCKKVLKPVCKTVRVAKWVATPVCKPIPGGKKAVRLCHANCTVTQTVLRPWRTPRLFSKVLGIFKRFLDRHKREIVTLHLEDKVGNKQRVMQAFAAAGLTRYLYEKPAQGGWPTLAEMRRTNRRLVVFTSSKYGRGPLHHAWTHTVENTYNLGDGKGCVRRGESKPVNDRNLLFTMNHFYQLSVRSPIEFKKLAHKYSKVNDARVIQKRIRRVCKRAPNFLTVDFAGKGDHGGARAVVRAHNRRYGER